jgi:WD40 repeat protein
MLAALLGLSLVPCVWGAGQGEQKPAAGKDVYGDPLPEGAVARMGTIRWRHSTTVSFAAFLPDGKSVLSVTDDRTIRVWEFPSGKELRRFEKPAPVDAGPATVAVPRRLQPSTPICLSPDGNVLACYFGGTAIQLYDVATGKALAPLKIDTGPRGLGGAVALDFSPDSKNLAVQNLEGAVRIYDWAQNKQTKQLNDKSQVISAQTGPTFIAHSPDGKLLAAMVLGLKDGMILSSIKLWDVASGKETREIPLKAPATNGAAVFSPDSKQVAYTQGDGSITVVEAATGNEVSRMRQNKGAVRFGGGFSLVFGPGGKSLYVRSASDNRIDEWEVATGKLLRQVGPDVLDPRGGTRVIMQPRLVLGPEAKTLVLSGTDQMIRFIDLASGKEVNVTSGLDALTPMDLARFSPDGKRLWTQAGSTTLAWDVDTGKFLGKIGPKLPRRAVFSDNGRFAVFPDEQRREMSVIDNATGKVVGSIPPQFSAVPELALSPDGKTLAVRRRAEQVIELVDTETGKVRQSLPIVSGDVQRGPAVGAGLPPAPGGMLFSPDGKSLVAYADQEKLAQWDVTTGRKRTIELSEALFQAPAHVVAFSPDGRCLALDVRGSSVVLLELATGTERKVFGKALPPPQNNGGIRVGGFPTGQVAINTVAFAGDGKRLAHAANDGKVHVWDATTGEELRSFAGHTGIIRGVAFAGDGKRLASVSTDTTALVWDLSPLKAAVNPPVEMTAADAETRWNALENPQGAAGFKAILELAASPVEALKCLRSRLKAAPALDDEVVQKLLVQLDSEKFKERQQASADLIKLGERVVPALEKALAAKPALEMQRRLETLIDRLAGPRMSGEQLRTVRAVEVLERIDSKDARELLQQLAEGAPGALMTIHSRAALERMGR